MKLAAALTLLAFAPLACTPTEPKAASPTPAGPRASTEVPESLAALYPPRAKEPAYLFAMLRLDAAFTGIVTDTTEGDRDGARATFRDFQAQYAAAAALVPEWTERFPAESVDALGTALEGGNVPAVMAAVDRVGQSCHSCHATSMVPVQQKYRWGNFATVRPRDPLFGKDVDFRTWKHLLSANLNGVTHNLRQGQVANARRQFQELSARFQGLRATCLECHPGRDRHFVDRDMEALLEKAGEALSSDRVTAEEVAPLLQRFGQESCAGCHLVHVPAAMAAGSGR